MGQVGGSALWAVQDVDVGVDGVRWVIDGDEALGGAAIARVVGDRVEKLDGAAFRIAASADGQPWVVGVGGTVWMVGAERKVFRMKGADWSNAGTSATAISVASDGSAVARPERSH